MEIVFVCLQGLTFSSEAKSLEYLLGDIGIPAPPVLKSEELTMVNTLYSKVCVSMLNIELEEAYNSV